MPNIVLWVEYELHEGKQKEFTEFLKDHAKHTLKDEPSCLRFEVTIPTTADGVKNPNVVVLNELYSGLEGIAAHQKSPRLAAMREKIAPWVKSRKATMCEVQ